MEIFVKHTLRGKCSCLEFFWSVFSHIRTEYGDSVQMRENTDQKNYECGRFLRSDILLNIVIPF